jgi:hypothetical protein
MQRGRLVVGLLPVWSGWSGLAVAVPAGQAVLVSRAVIRMRL